MKTVLKGKKQNSISFNGFEISWSRLVDYECREVGKNESTETVNRDTAANGISTKNYLTETLSSSSSENENEAAKDSQKKNIKKPVITSTTPPPMHSKPQVKNFVPHENAQTQCEPDKNDFSGNVNIADIKEIYQELNSVFKRRFEDIESKVPNDVEIKIKTHEEWCKSLMKCSEAILEGIKNLKTEFKKFAAAPLIVSETELKFEQDRDNLTKLLQKRLQSGKFNFENLELETLPFKEILSLDSDYLSEFPSSPHRRHTERNRARLKSPFTKPKQ